MGLVDRTAAGALRHVPAHRFGALGQAAPGSRPHGPPVFPRPDLLVTLTGVLEILGALGLLLPYTARLAGLGLCLLLFCLFPANVRAAREKLAIAGRPVPALLPRAAIQVVFVVATLAVVLGRD